jgi:environmental stress-induced protein Ves
MSPLDVVAFAGRSAVSAGLPAGPARDLNLMLRRGRVEATMEPLVLDAEHPLAMDDSLIVLCAIDSSLAVVSGGARVVLEDARQRRDRAGRGGAR